MGEPDPNQCLITQIIIMVMFTLFTCNMAHLVLEQFRSNVVHPRQNLFDIFSMDFNDGRLDDFDTSRFQSFFPNEPEQRMFDRLSENNYVSDLNTVGLYFEERGESAYLYGNLGPAVPEAPMKANEPFDRPSVENNINPNNINEDQLENNFMWDHDEVMEELIALARVDNDDDDDEGPMIDLGLYDAMEDALPQCDSGIEDNEE